MPNVCRIILPVHTCWRDGIGRRTGLKIQRGDPCRFDSGRQHFPGRLAQLGERLPYKQGVVGSSPASSIDFISYIEQPRGCFFLLFSYLPFPFSATSPDTKKDRRKPILKLRYIVVLQTISLWHRLPSRRRHNTSAWK